MLLLLLCLRNLTIVYFYEIDFPLILNVSNGKWYLPLVQLTQGLVLNSQCKKSLEMMVAVNTILQKNLNICKFCSFMNFLGCEMARHTFLSLFQEYSNCACVNQTTSNRSAVVISGQCESECNLLYYVFVPIGVIHFFFIFLNNTPVTVATLRYVLIVCYDRRVMLETF